VRPLQLHPLLDPPANGDGRTGGKGETALRKRLKPPRPSVLTATAFSLAMAALAIYIEVCLYKHPEILGI
jgi:hypothetical protein